MMFEVKYFSRYILLNHQILLPGCLYLLRLLGNMCIVIAYFPGYDVINFEINFSFLIKPFPNMTKKSAKIQISFII